MTEIKLIQSEVENALSELKNKADGFDTSNPSISFSESRLDLLAEITKMEQKYYSIIDQYQNLLIRTEQDMRTLIEQLVQKDKELSQKMK
ncbi:YwqI/YxiC family protein [Neobacillus sp. WH10]|uniref:YwqI/YxiC family protein n=1 Tax=Neobacillus sp. WH10 TaxID=3047873 RepID=UPI0024C1A21B|nr:YwqI/YxiC family protein [Neobacillus sp. WH10]WHY78034.1 YwqI/YxiC family protein [Neobacillus sp. WH10]